MRLRPTPHYAPTHPTTHTHADALRHAGLSLDLSKEQKIDKLFSTQPDDNLAAAVDVDEPSHMHVPRDDDGDPIPARFTYVDEHACIGCTLCVGVARSTFFMEPDMGRARVFNQGADADEVIDEAVASCPVNCIHYVTLDDLTILEKERDGQVINFKGTLVGGDAYATRVPQSEAKVFNMGGQSKCGNCPARGCKSCPMYGIGESPVYKKRLKDKEARKKERKLRAAKKEEKRREEAIFAVFDEQPPVELTGMAPPPGLEAAPPVDALDAVNPPPPMADTLSVPVVGPPPAASPPPLAGEELRELQQSAIFDLFEEPVEALALESAQPRPAKSAVDPDDEPSDPEVGLDVPAP